MSNPKQDVRLLKVYSSEWETLKEYVEALYAHDEDFDAMVNIEDGLKHMLRNENLATAYFIHEGSERVGYVILARYLSVEKGGLTFFIDELYVEESFRRHGIGKRIMEKIFDIARIEGAKALWVQTETFNKAAQEFFRGQGFTSNSYLNFERPL
jgi:GNAT superfamily N-acetyltransferase